MEKWSLEGRRKKKEKRTKNPQKKLYFACAIKKVNSSFSNCEMNLKVNLLKWRFQNLNPIEKERNNNYQFDILLFFSIQEKLKKKKKMLKKR